MSKPHAEPGSAQALVELRRARILAVVGSRSASIDAPAEPTPPARAEFFCREAEELYWNELAWEQATDEEAIAGGHLTEMVFPGLLALVHALLPEQAADGDTDPRCRAYPDVVEEILTFLGERAAELTAELAGGADSQEVLWARAMTLRLVDLVLYRLYRLSASEREQVEAGG